MSEQLDLNEGLRRKEEGIQRVLANNQIWLAGAVAHLVNKLAIQETICADDLRDYQAPVEPSSENCAGGVWNRMRNANLITFTGRTTLSHAKPAHARLIRVWRKFDPATDKPFVSKSRQAKV